MKTKIQISPAMREFNEAVEACDVLTDYELDRLSAQELLARMRERELYRYHASWLANAIAGIAVKR